jgi:hypothetical protein
MVVTATPPEGIGPRIVDNLLVASDKSSAHFDGLWRTAPPGAFRFSARTNVIECPRMDGVYRRLQCTSGIDSAMQWPCPFSH